MGFGGGFGDDEDVDLDPNSEEYIMKFVMQESLKMHQEEEQKRSKDG